MSNPLLKTSQSLATYFKSVNPSLEEMYNLELNSYLAVRSTQETYLYGLPEQQFAHALAATLTSLGNDPSLEENLRSILWNPVVANLIKCITTMSYRKPLSQLQVDVSGPPQKRAVSTQPSPSLKKKSTNVKQSSSPPRPQPKLLKPLSSSFVPEQAKGVPTPIVPRYDKEDKPTLEDRRSLIALVGRDSDYPVFKNQTKKFKGCVTCTTPKCDTCKHHAMQMPLTKCVSIKDHALTPCHSSGWYPHVLPRFWGLIRQAHKQKAATAISYNGLDAMVHTTPLITQADTLKGKRRWQNGDATSPSTTDDEIEPPQKWSAIVDQEDQETPPVPLSPGTSLVPSTAY